MHRTERDMEVHDKNRDGMVSFKENEPPSWVRNSVSLKMGIMKFMRKPFCHQKPAFLASTSSRQHSTFVKRDVREYVPSPLEKRLFEFCVRSGFPHYLNWAEKITLTIPIDQGEDGSCMQASTIGSSESCYALTYGETMMFDHRELWEYTGGAYDVVDYPRDQIYHFMSKFGALSMDGKMRLKVKFDYVPNFFGVIEALQTTTVVSALKATIGFNILKTKILCSKVLGGTDHDVEVIGYHLRKNAPSYVIVRNSYGLGWAVNGIGRIKIGACGLAKFGYAPRIIGRFDSSTIVPAYVDWVKRKKSL